LILIFAIIALTVSKATRWGPGLVFPRRLRLLLKQNRIEISSIM